MSVNISELIEQDLINENNDFFKVLRKVKNGFQNRGFFVESNWMEILKASFSDNDGPVDEIDSTFDCYSATNVATSSRLHLGKNQTTDVELKPKSETPVNDIVTANTTHDIFDESITRAKPNNRLMSIDSNDSFEIPETQPDPPTKAAEDGQSSEDESEGFIEIPIEEVATNNDCDSQSQNLLCRGVLFDYKINVHEATVEEEKLLPENNAKSVIDDISRTLDHLDDDDGIDLEMSKLEWAESTKEDEDSKSASVTPDLDFELLSSTKIANFDAQADDSKEIENNNNVSKLVNGECNELPKSNETSNDVGSDGEKISQHQPIEKEDVNKPTMSFDNKEKITKDGENHTSNIEDEPLDETQLFAKPDRPKVENSDDEDDIFNVATQRMEANQLFVKPHLPAAKNTHDVEAQLFAKSDRPLVHHVSLPNVETYLFVKPDAAENTHDIGTQLFVKSNRSVADNFDDVATQLFVKPDRFDAENKDDEDDVATQRYEATQLFVKPNRPAENTHDVKAQFVKRVRPIVQHVNLHDSVETQLFVKPDRTVTDSKDDDDDVYNNATQKYEVSKPASRKRNRLISSSDDEYSTDDDLPIPHKIIKTPSVIPSSSKKVVTPNTFTKDIETSVTNDIETVNDHLEVQYSTKNEKYECLEVLKGSTWTDICSVANEKQSTAKYINVFDQCKDIQIVNESGIVADMVHNLRKPDTTTAVDTVEVVTRKSSRTKKMPNKFIGLTAVTETNNKTGTVSNQSIKPSVSSSTLANVKSSKPSKSNVDDAAAQLVVVKETNDKKKVKNTKPSESNDDATAQFAAVKETKDKKKLPSTANTSVRSNLRSNKKQEYGEQPSSSRISNQNITSVSSSSLTDVKGKEPNQMNDDDVSTQVFVKPTKEQKKVILRSYFTHDLKDDDSSNRENMYESMRSTRSTKTENTTAKSSDNQGDDDQTSTDTIANRSRKRKAVETITSIPSKISQSLSSLNSPIPSNSSMNRSSRHQNLRVMFTMINPEPYKPILKQLNIIMVKPDETYDALVTDKVYRSSKFMCALASGKPIVSTEWLKALQENKSRVDPFKFLLKDVEGEKKYKFSLANTISKSKKQPFFNNYSILVTPNTSPEPEILKDVIVSSGGKYLKTSLAPRKDDDVLCVSDIKDEKMWPQLKKKYANLHFVSVEGFMQAIFQYNLNLKAYGLGK